MYTCRECEHPLNQGTEICPYCGTDLTATVDAEAEQWGRKPGLWPVLVRWGMVLVPITAALWGFLWYVLPQRQLGGAALTPEAVALESMREIRLALASYASAQGSAFPPSLEVLEGRARGPAQNALGAGYRIEYVPGARASDGAIHNYVLLARPGQYGYRSFYTDETGVFRVTAENRPANSEDPVWPESGGT